jgi:deoxyribodipyrimidine photo-lyase
MKSSIVWFRNDLRLVDNAALVLAIKRGLPVIPLYIFAPEEKSPWSPGGAARCSNGMTPKVFRQKE